MDETTPLIQANHTSNFVSCFRLRRRGFCVTSKPAVFILIWTFLVAVIFNLGDSTVVISLLSMQEQTIGLQLGLRGLTSFALLFSPLAGYIADIHCGRGRTIAFGLLFTLGGAAIGFIIPIVIFAEPTASQDSYRHIQVSLLAVMGLTYIVVGIGLTAFWANIVQFGTDQLQEASGEELSAFIHWFIWTSNLGYIASELFIVAQICSSNSEPISIILPTLGTLLFLSALCFSYFTRGWFTTVNFGERNPYRTAFKVIKFALEHKRPVWRSAFTYCEDEPPSRLDLGKEKYGGPFTTEQVEDVKTVSRILTILIFVGLCLGFISAYPNTYFAGHLNTNGGFQCSLDTLLDGLLTLIILVLIPVYLAIRPYFQRCHPNMLTKMGIGVSMVLISILWRFALDTYGHAKHRDVPCMYAAAYTGNQSLNFTASTLDLDTALLIPSDILSGIGMLLMFLTALEFICAQSPQVTKGLLIGAFFAIQALFNLIGNLLILPFYLPWSRNKPTFPSCGFSYFLLNALIVFVALFLFVTFARKYKYRQRDEERNERQYAEAYYAWREFSETSFSMSD